MRSLHIRTVSQLNVQAEKLMAVKSMQIDNEQAAR
jgi:hypothetical protein